MKTLIELADEYARNCFSDGVHDSDIEHPHTEKARAALVAGIEELQAEVERLKSERDRNLDSIRVNNEIINKKNAELAKLKGAEPVAYWIPKAEQFCIADKSGRPFAKAWEPLYAGAAPQAPAPEANGWEVSHIPTRTGTIYGLERKIEGSNVAQEKRDSLGRVLRFRSEKSAIKHAKGSIK